MVSFDNTFPRCLSLLSHERCRPMVLPHIGHVYHGRDMVFGCSNRVVCVQRRPLRPFALFLATWLTINRLFHAMQILRLRGAAPDSDVLRRRSRTRFLITGRSDEVGDRRCSCEYILYAKMCKMCMQFWMLRNLQPGFRIVLDPIPQLSVSGVSIYRCLSAIRMAVATTDYRLVWSWSIHVLLKQTRECAKHGVCRRSQDRWEELKSHSPKHETRHTVSHAQGIRT